MEILILLVILLQYFILILSINKKNYDLFVIIYIIHLFFYDYVFINASYYLPSFLVNTLKPFSEYLFLFLIIKSISRSTKSIRFNPIDKLVFLCFIIPSVIILVVNDLGNLAGFSETVQGIRTYLLPVIIPYLIYKRGWLSNLSLNKVSFTLIWLSVIAVAYGFYQRSTFSGNVSTLWFADFFKKFKEDPVVTAPFDFIRNDVLRTTSFFVSPILYSFSIAMPAILTVSMLFSKDFKRSKIMLILILSILIFGLYISETRIGILNLLIGFVVLALAGLSKRKHIFGIMLLTPFLCILITFGTLVYGYTDDLSALGRVTEYASFFEYFKWDGLGFSDENVLTKFDTFYMSITLVYGILAILPIIFLYKTNKKLFIAYNKPDQKNRYFFLSVLAVSLTFIYSYAFQFTAGSYPYKLIYLLTFIVLSNRSSHANEKAHYINTLQM